eukprot:7248549-Pyramimonas_sp.AAC.2
MRQLIEEDAKLTKQLRGEGFRGDRATRPAMRQAQQPAPRRPPLRPQEQLPSVVVSSPES